MTGIEPAVSARWPAPGGENRLVLHIGLNNIVDPTGLEPVTRDTLRVIRFRTAVPYHTNWRALVVRILQFGGPDLHSLRPAGDEGCSPESVQERRLAHRFGETVVANTPGLPPDPARCRVSNPVGRLAHPDGATSPIPPVARPTMTYSPGPEASSPRECSPSACVDGRRIELLERAASRPYLSVRTSQPGNDGTRTTSLLANGAILD